MKLFVSIRSLLAMLLVASALQAQAAGLALQDYYLGGLVTYLEPNEVRLADTEAPGAQLLAGAALSELPGWGLEVSAAWNELVRSDGPGHDQIYQLGVDVLRHFSFRDGLQPFLLAGLAASYEDIREDDSVRPSLGVGGGLKWQTPVPALSLRFDARALAQENDYAGTGAAGSGRTVLVDGRFGVGVQWLLAAATQVVDADADGVADAYDLCPGSLPDAQVDGTGCEALSSADSDNDGVTDAADQCPGTPSGSVVGETGCGDADEVQLRGVTFEPDSEQLTAEARDILAPVAQLLNGGLANIRVEIAGHTDSLGTADYNQALSARRAWAVKNFLTEQGVASSRLIATGYGSGQPVADNATAEGRAKNRRVVFRVIE